jgi:hypothetical protein
VWRGPCRRRAAEVGENDQRALPGVTRGREIAGGSVDVADADESVSFVVPIADFAAKAEGVPTAGENFLAVAEMVVVMAEAVHRGGVPDAVVEFLKQAKGRLRPGRPERDSGCWPTTSPTRTPSRPVRRDRERAGLRRKCRCLSFRRLRVR